MVVDRPNCSRIGKREGYLDLALALGNHLRGQTLSESRQFHDRFKCIPMTAGSSIFTPSISFGESDLAMIFPRVFSGTEGNGQLHAVFVA